MKMRSVKTAFLIILASVLLSVPARSNRPDERYNEIIKRGTVRIGISTHYPPLNFNSGEKGAEITMAREFAAFLGVEPVLIPLEVHEFVKAVTGRRVDIIMASMSRNLTRARHIWFSESYLSITPGVLAARNALPQTRFGDQFEQPPLRTIWDLERVSRFRFAVKRDSSYEEILKEHFPDMERVYFDTNEEGLELLISGKADGLVHDSLYLEHLYRNSPDLRQTYSFLQGGRLIEEICAGLPAGEYFLKVQLDTFISEMKRTGRISELLKEYN